MFAPELTFLINGKITRFHDAYHYFDSCVFRYVTYEEFPRNEDLYPGNTTEHYPDYIVGWFLVVNPLTSKRIANSAQVCCVQIISQE